MLYKIKVCILKYRVLPLWPTCQGERRTTFAKAYGINVRCHWELLEEHVRNLGTLCVEDHPRSKKRKKKLPSKVDCPLPTPNTT
jgi:hypothetical protein